MGLLGLIGNAVSTVGNVITHIGKTIGSEALTNFGKSVSGFGESIGQGSSSSGDDSSDSTDEDSSQGRSGRKRKKQLEPELPPDVEDGLLKYLHEPEEIFPDFMTLWHVSEQNERALEVARHLSIFGLPIVQGITVAEYLTRFAWHIWDEEDDAAALRVVEMAWENYRADFAMARRDKKGDVIPDRVPVKGDYREMQILRDVPFDGHTLNQDSNGTNVDNRTVEEIQGDIQETYNVSIEDDVPLNLEAARNYERALGEVASLFADVLDLPDLTTKQKGKLFSLF